MPFDLLLAYQPTIDEAEHQFRMVSDTQLYATPANLSAAERVRRAAYETFNRAVAALTGGLDQARDAIVITGDHGLAAVDTEVRLNQLLVDWSFASADGKAPAESSHWAAYTTGNVAHLYRFSAPDDSDALIKKLQELRSPDGALVFERVDRKTAASHPNSGDIVAYAYPRFGLSSALSGGLENPPQTGDPFVRPAYYGQHGGLSSHHEFHTTLGASGAGVFAETIPSILQTQIARYVCDLLGIAPPAQAE